jgi:hypothetical protein
MYTDPDSGADMFAHSVLYSGLRQKQHRADLSEMKINAPTAGYAHRNVLARVNRKKTS